MATILGKMQIGKEDPAAHGTGVAATVLLPIKQKQMPVDRKPTTIDHDIGKNVEITGSMVQGILVKDTLSWDQGFFEILPFLFSGFFKGGITPVEQTTDQEDFLWSHEPNLDEIDNDLDSYTIERGDSLQSYEHNYCLFNNLKLSTQVNQDGGEHSVKIDAEYFARENVTSSFTPALSPLPLTFMNGKLSRVYLDTLWVDVGKTELTGLLRSWDLEIVNGVHPRFNGGSVETFNDHESGAFSFLLNLTLQRSALTETLRAAIGSTRALRLTVTGPKIGTGKNHELTVDMFGIIEDVVPLGSTDRTKSPNLDTFVLQGKYDPVGGKLIVPSVVTKLASI
jgi:hypothetical protein